MKFFQRNKASSTLTEKQQDLSHAAPASTATSTSENDTATTTAFQYTPHDELYGQKIPKETPELISSKLQDLEKELDLIPGDDKTDWNMALQKCPDLCNDKFKLMFLRCEVFNCDLAAKRIVKYWQRRVLLFGESAFEPLVLGPNGPFKNDDKALKEIAFVRCVNEKDLAGRPIMFGDPSRLPADQSSYENESVARSVWYFMHAVLEDETAQRKGVVFIMFPKNVKLGAFNRKLTQMNAESIKGCIPVRVSAIHICHPPKIFDLIFPILKVLMGAHLRKKVNLNSGSEEKVLEKLKRDYGISSEKIPSDMGGGLVLDHEVWLEDRLSKGL